MNEDLTRSQDNAYCNAHCSKNQTECQSQVAKRVARIGENFERLLLNADVKAMIKHRSAVLLAAARARAADSSRQCHAQSIEEACNIYWSAMAQQ